MGSLVQGQAVGGIVTAIINIISIEGSTDPTLSAFYCFLVATIFIAFDVGAFVAMTKTPFYEVCNFIETIEREIHSIYYILSNKVTKFFLKFFSTTNRKNQNRTKM